MGIGNLGRRNVEAVQEPPPEHYKPAVQDFDLPLSAQFGGGGSSSSSYSYQQTPEPSLTTENYQYSTESNIYQYETDSSNHVHGDTENMNTYTDNIPSPGDSPADLQTNSYDSELNTEYSNNEYQAVEDVPDLTVETVERQENVVDNFQSEELETEPEEVQSDPAVSLVPDWLHLLAAAELKIDQERLSFVTVVALTIVLMFFISGFLTSTASQGPLKSKIDQMEKRLADTLREIHQLRQESSASNFDINENNPKLREHEVKLEQVRQELETSRDLLRGQEIETNGHLAELENKKQELEVAKRETRQAEEMMEELVAEQKNKQSSGDIVNVIKQLQVQFEQQKETLKKYEPRLKKKDKENKELSLTMRQLKADAANANLETDKLRNELESLVRQKQEASSKVEDISKNDDEWKSLANLLQKQLDEKCDEIYGKEKSSSELKLRLTEIERKSESTEEQIEILEEVIKEIKKKDLIVEEKDGWEVEGDGWNDTSEDLIDLEDLKSRNSELLAKSQTLKETLQQVRSELEASNSSLSKHKDDCSEMRSERDEKVKEFSETQKKLEVLTEFFNKKEAELQKQIGLQSAKFGDVSSDAEDTNKRLVIISGELESAKEDLRGLRKEVEEQERSLKSSVSEQEKKAHECWVAARQAERKVTEVQSETSVLRSRLTIAESRNESLEKEKGELEGAIKSLQGSVKSESGKKVSYCSKLPSQIL